MLLKLLLLLGLQAACAQFDPRIITRLNAEIASRGRAGVSLDSELVQIGSPITFTRNSSLTGGGSTANSLLVQQFQVGTTPVADEQQSTSMRLVALSPEFPARLVSAETLSKLLGQYASVFGGRLTILECIPGYTGPAIEVKPTPTPGVAAIDSDGDGIFTTVINLSNLLIVNCSGPAIKVMPGSASKAEVNIANTIFYKNTNLVDGVNSSSVDNSRGNGGAIYVEDVQDDVVTNGPFTTKVPAKVQLDKCMFVSNKANQGSAIYVGPGNNELVMRRSVFHANGQDTGTSGTEVYGSAVFVNTSQMTAVEACTFVGNGFAPRKWPGLAVNISTVNAPIVRGGAIRLEEPLMTVSFRNSVFVNNSASQGGGAVAVHNLIRPYNMEVTDCTFQDNWAGGELSTGENVGAGGAVWLRETFDTLLLNNTWLKNYGARSGGAVWSSLSYTTSVLRNTFKDNWVLSGEGGAWYGVKDGTTTWDTCTFLNNMASSGGGIACNRDVSCVVKNSVFFNNSAAELAGAIECANCLGMSVSNCNITRNVASSAAGMALVPIHTGNVTDTTFADNLAATNGTGITCSRDAQGAAGGLCVGGSPELPIFVNRTRFLNNSASNGGAILSDQTCLNEGCTNLQIFDTEPGRGDMYVGNKALTGGGGVVWMREPDTVAFVCTPSDSLSASGPQPNPCPTWSRAGLGNQAGYGNVTASSGATLSLDPAVYTVAASYLASGVFNRFLPAVVNVKDSYGQIITAGSTEATPRLLVAAESNNGSQPQVTLSGDTFVTAVNGTATFSTLRLFAAPGTYNLTFTQTGLAANVTPIQLNVNVRTCRIGEISNRRENGVGDQCNACLGSFFSFNPANDECDSCPENAICDYKDKAWGSILVPNKGFWHSSPLSGQIFSCPSKAACSGNEGDFNTNGQGNRFRQLADFQVRLAQNPNVLNIARDRDALNVSGYFKILCQEGHEGNLCAGCSDGFGRQGNGKCAKCPNQGANTTFFIVAICVMVFILSLTITTQLEAHDDELLETTARTSNPTASVLASPPVPRDARQSDTRPPRQQEDESMPGMPPLIGSPATSPKPLPEDDSLRASKVVLAVAEGAHPEPGTPKSVRIEEGAEQAGKTPTDSRRTTSWSVRFRLPSFRQLPWHKSPGRGTFVRNLMVRQKTRGRLALKNDGLTRTFQSHSAVIKILVNYLQVAAIIRNVSLEWPAPVSAFLSSANQASATVGTFVSLDCSLVNNRVPKSIQSVIVMCSVPLVIICASIPVWSLLWYFSHRTKSIIWGRYKAYLRNRFTITALATVFFFYPTVTTQLLSVFSCPELDVASRPTGENSLAVGRFWAADYTVECYQGQHLVLMLALAIPGTILFCVGVPLGSALFLWYNKQRLRDVDFTRTYAFIYADYKDDFYYWESVVLLRKFLLILVVVFGMKAGLMSQLLLSLGIIVLGSFVATIMQPYRMSRLDYLDRLSQWGNSLVVYLALYLALEEVPSLPKQAVSILLVVTGTILVVYLLLQIIKEYIWVQMRMIDHDNDGLLSRHDIKDFLASKQGELQLNRIYAHTLSWSLNFISKSAWRKKYLSYFFIFPSEHLLDVPGSPGTGPPRSTTTYHLPTLPEGDGTEYGSAEEGRGSMTNGAGSGVFYTPDATPYGSFKQV